MCTFHNPPLSLNPSFDSNARFTSGKMLPKHASVQNVRVPVFSGFMASCFFEYVIIYQHGQLHCTIYATSSNSFSFLLNPLPVNLLWLIPKIVCKIYIEHKYMQTGIYKKVNGKQTAVANKIRITRNASSIQYYRSSFFMCYTTRIMYVLLCRLSGR